jgi:DNA-binding SARP family transcriptional activator
VIEFRTLGTLDLRAADGRELHTLLAQPKRIALLAYLCLAQPHGYHRRDTLLGLFWPDSDQEHARASLRKSLHVLRHALGEDAFLARGDEEVAVDASSTSPRL